MRYLLFITALLLLTLSASAQKQENLFDSPIEHGGFGAFAGKIASIRGETGLLLGGYGGWLINHQFMIGGGGYGLVTNVRASTEAQIDYAPFGDPLYVQFGYGGVMLEYIFMPAKLVHFNVQVLVGGGSVSYQNNYYSNVVYAERGYGGHYGPYDAVFVAEPAVHVELNMTDWFRIVAGGSYRYVSGVSELTGIGNSDLSGVSGTIALKFGTF